MSTQDGRWWTKPWNPLRVKGGGWHCTKISPGCRNCWAEGYNMRFGNGTPFNTLMYPVGFELDLRILEQPLHWKKPQIVAVQWVGDLFHEQIRHPDIIKIIKVIRECQQHIFLILTKRPAKVKEHYLFDAMPNLWLGVSISTQQEADEKIPILLQTPAAHRFVNIEPCLEKIEIWPHLPSEMWDWTYTEDRNKLDWVCLGCENDPGRRPMKLEWVRNIAEQCKAAGVPLWIKQLDINGKVSKNMAEWDEDLKIRQWPW